MSATPTVKASYTPVDIGAAKLDHAAWDRAPSTQITRYWSGDEAPHRRHAEARIIWSPNALAVRFVCRQNEPFVVSSNPQTKTKSLGLWDRDVCEIFIAPDPDDIDRYYEFEASPTGEWIDLSLQTKPNGRETNWDFQSGMSAAARIEDDNITIAMRIPWSDSIKKPLPGQTWRINLCRCIGSGPNRGYLAWQPTRTKEPNFHVPNAFGVLVFAE